MSIIVPAYNEEHGLGGVLTQLSAIQAEMTATGADHVHLDVTHMFDKYLMWRFPRIYRTCKELGIDISREPIPVSPAAHYAMGGVLAQAGIELISLDWGETATI